MSDPIAVILGSYLPAWLSAQVASSAIGLLLGVAIGAGLARFSSWLTRRRERIDADETLRKLEAKKWNEHIKLYGSFANTLGIAVVGAAFIIPYIKDHTWPAGDAAWWIAGGLLLPASGQCLIRLLQSEN